MCHLSYVFHRMQTENKAKTNKQKKKYNAVKFFPSSCVCLV